MLGILYESIKLELSTYYASFGSGRFAEEEVHQDQYETELDNLEKFGANYLALQSVERSKSVAVGTAPAGE